MRDRFEDKTIRGVKDLVEIKQRKMCEEYNQRKHVKVHEIKAVDYVRIKLPYKEHKLSQGVSDPILVVNVEGDICTLSDGKRWHTNRLVKVHVKDTVLPEDFTDMSSAQSGQNNDPIIQPRVLPNRTTRGKLPSKYNDFVIFK